jgi:hypothetical protein
LERSAWCAAGSIDKVLAILFVPPAELECAGGFFLSIEHDG